MQQQALMTECEENSPTFSPKGSLPSPFGHEQQKIFPHWAWLRNRLSQLKNYSTLVDDFWDV
ncbi:MULTISPECIES: hypothetical protein [Paenibacillus]|uniref:hypothetical protein n=1 Tax=Paenibacillus TaxID=44249 RepID=UPI001072E494|nr:MULTISPECIES: hypothetical protein [Paenibacillus]